MAADDIAGMVRHFDSWYAAMAGSARRDEIVQRNLGLPGTCCRAVCCRGRASPKSLSCCVCGHQRGWSTWPVVGAATDSKSRARTGASLIGIDFSAEAIRQAAEYADSLGRDARFVVADIAAIALPAASVDGVMCHRRRPHRLRAGGRVRRAPPGAPGLAGVPWLTDWEGAGPRQRRLPEWRRVDCAGWFAAAGFIDDRRGRAAAGVGAAGNGRCGPKRPSSTRTETTPSRRSASEAIEVMPHVPLTRRVLASATAPPHPVAH